MLGGLELQLSILQSMVCLAKYATFGILYKPSWMHITTQQTVYIRCSNVNPSATVTGTNDRYARNSSLCILKVS
jgi:hypothetical protein